MLDVYLGLQTNIDVLTGDLNAEMFFFFWNADVTATIFARSLVEV